MDNALSFLGIYTDAMKEAITTCEEVLEEYGFSITEIDDMNDYAKAHLSENCNFDDITNSVIYAYFSVTASMLKEKLSEETEIDFFVNCHDSHFYINGESQ